MTGSSRYPIRTSIVYPPPSNNRASVACTFEDATRIRAPEKRSGLITSTQRELHSQNCHLCSRRSQFGDDKVATEISADANPPICFEPHLFRTILSTSAVFQSLGPL